MSDNTYDKAGLEVGGAIPKFEGRAFAEPDSGELEVTSPGRIYRPDQVAALLGRGSDKEALEALKAIAENTAAISKRLERWERDGMPVERLTGYEVA